MQMNKQYSKVSLYSGVNLDISEPDPDVPDEIGEKEKNQDIVIDFLKNLFV